MESSIDRSGEGGEESGEEGGRKCGGSAMPPADRVAIVVLTYNRPVEVRRTLRRLFAAGEAAAVCVVDNGSTDGGSADGGGGSLASEFPAATVVRLPHNLGAAGRNYGVRALPFPYAPYVAFCDDDTWWAPGALAAAQALLDAYPRLAVVTARVLVGPEEREDPTSGVMAASPLDNSLAIPGATAVAGLLAGACVMRREAFLAAGGYEPRLFLGGEERLLALDLMAAGWQLAYAPRLVVHHHPSRLRDAPGRRRLLVRNALWCAWLRRPLASALRETARQLAAVAREPALAVAVAAACRGLPWVLKARRVIPAEVERQLRLVEGGRSGRRIPELQPRV